MLAHRWGFNVFRVVFQQITCAVFKQHDGAHSCGIQTLSNILRDHLLIHIKFLFGLQCLNVASTGHHMVSIMQKTMWPLLIPGQILCRLFNFVFIDLLLIPNLIAITELTCLFSLAGNDGACIFHVGPVKKGGRELHGCCIYLLFSTYIHFPCLFVCFVCV